VGRSPLSTKPAAGSPSTNSSMIARAAGARNTEGVRPFFVPNHPRAGSGAPGNSHHSPRMCSRLIAATSPGLAPVNKTKPSADAHRSPTESSAGQSLLISSSASTRSRLAAGLRSTPMHGLTLTTSCETIHEKIADAADSAWFCRIGPLIADIICRTCDRLIDDGASLPHLGNKNLRIRRSACFQLLFLFIACSVTYRSATSANVLPARADLRSATGSRPSATCTATRCAIRRAWPPESYRRRRRAATAPCRSSGKRPSTPARRSRAPAGTGRGTAGPTGSAASVPAWRARASAASVAERGPLAPVRHCCLVAASLGSTLKQRSSRFSTRVGYGGFLEMSTAIADLEESFIKLDKARRPPRVIHG